eukprot:1150707-Pelagomonas_calceolata.AAC.3
MHIQDQNDSSTFPLYQDITYWLLPGIVTSGTYIQRKQTNVEQRGVVSSMFGFVIPKAIINGGTQLIRHNGISQASWMAASDVPTYQLGQWERLLGKSTDICNPMHFAMIHRRMEIAKLLLKLGANVRQHTATSNDPMFSVREKRLSSVSVNRQKVSGSC